MTKSKDERWAELHETALKQFNRIQAAHRDERLQCLQDRRFYSIAGAQWEGPLGDQFEKKARFEFNRVHLAVIRIFNEYRNNRITVNFTPKDGSDDTMSETCDGLYRADEKTCTADEAYDNAFEEGVGGGMGAWRVRSRYEDEYDEDSDQQRVCMEPIFDADSCVFFDLDAKRYDKADSQHCFVLTPYSVEGYKEKFDDDPATWPKLIHQHEFDWLTTALVWVAEYYLVEDQSQLIHYYRGLDEDQPDTRVAQSEIDADETLHETLTATGHRVVRQKRVQRKRVHKYLLSGGGILSDEGIVAGQCIPIVPFYGKRWVVDGVERCMGHVRLAKDAQRLTNMLMSSLAEMAARFDQEKPILTPQQIQGHAAMWAEDNVKRYPYLLVNLLTDDAGNQVAGPMQYTKAPNVPPAMAALMQLAAEALTSLLGNQEAGEQIQPNISGKVVELIQSKLDMQVFIYMSNFAKSMKRSGEIWLSMMKEIAVEEGRKMKTIGTSGDIGSATINQPKVDGDGKEYVDNDFSKASFDIEVDVGPSSVSRRASTVRALTAMMNLTQDPETQNVLSSLSMMNMEGEGISDARSYFRSKLLKMGVVKPTPDEEKEMQAQAQAQAQQPPDPQSQYLMAAAEQATAAAAKERAKTTETIASATLKQAQAVKVQSETHGQHQDNQIAGVKAAHELIGQPPPSTGAP